MLFFEGFKILAWKTWMLRKKLAIHDDGSSGGIQVNPPKMGLSQMVVRLDGDVHFMGFRIRKKKIHLT